MLRLPLIAAVALGAVAATLTSAHDNAPTTSRPALAPLTGIEWSYAVQARDGEGKPYLRFARDGMNATVGADELPEVAAALAGVPTAASGEPVSFALMREAGTIACTGSVTAPGRAGGTCRFDPDARFMAALAASGLAPADDEDLLALAFVDARLALVEDLSSVGYAPADADELLTAAAIGVSGVYARELRRAGLEPEDLDELVTAKAVGVEPGWVGEMAEAGYPGLSLDKAIELRALGVTPDYARRMARVMRAVEGAE